AFRILGYTGDSVVVDMAFKGHSQGKTFLITMSYPLVWVDGDWRLMVSDATTPINTSIIATLDGYTPWGPP
ncbi:MAG: hypothetical protein FWE61_01445, partial [Micrococcales bacterium]|nr:hypothetical protein [Micrococcales bacterium]